MTRHIEVVGGVRIETEYDETTHKLGGLLGEGETLQREVILLTAEDTARRDVEARNRFKADRQVMVDAIKITTAAGNVFDGDETSQTRMARAVAGLLDGETITWVLADNSVIQATRSELIEALRLAGRAQEAIWVMP